MPSIHPTASSDIVFISPNNKGITKEWFQPEYWQAQHKLLNTATGRGTVWFVDTPHATAVLRQYRRGGLIGKFNKFSFLAQPLEHTRAYKELALLETLQKLKLPAPTPMAGLVRREGVSYQAWLLTQAIPNARDLFQILQQGTLTDDIWRNIGHTIRRFHDHNVFHSDLNCHNIMLDEQDQVWLIDFDKCAIKDNSAGWKKNNLERLQRSFDKELKKLSRFEYNQQAWQHLLEGYQAA
ncbi:3-deoxy-D-manno-octulosonic acid kinase [Marinomonas aquimarina]|uniref:3-deoxy-D-manno-octulosonic acid kinase n=1 Tax=Marinomonas aquimarina TaxID=295068 RepID=A0A1A8TES8_9GAMM|nr:3-deoxy-D-manno-octulosonic acid kinase [Marinomonas aquimarina]SBS30349.1 3-deoxy-D-manno-octulosonic acid kinase [Marinomonas aquimarina]